MSDTANAIRKKLERAEAHFLDLKTALGFGGSPIDSIATDSAQVDDQGNLVFRTKPFEPDREHGIMIGDVVHQTRSALDHIAYAMAKPVCADPRLLRKVQFPVFDDPAKLANSPRFLELKRLFGDLSPQITEIRESQPYVRNPAWPTADHLWIISELDNIDKHRTILVMLHAVTISGFSKRGDETRGFRYHKHPIKAGTAVMSLGWPSPLPPPEVNVERAAPFIVFSETDGLCDDMSIFPIIRNGIRIVGDVIDRFESRGLI